MTQTLSSGRKVPQRVRNELKFRTLTVSDKQLVAQQFWRISFRSEALAGFTSPGNDDHIKLFFPENRLSPPPIPSVTDEGIVWPDNQRPESRDYTPLEFNGRDSLTIDFFRHKHGVASEWAERVEIGETLTIGGPRGSLVIPEDYAQQLYIFDETGLPAMKRRLHSVKAENIMLIAFADRQVVEEYLGAQLADHILHCLEGKAMDESGVADCIGLTNPLHFPSDDHFVWLTGEGKAVKALSEHFVEQRGCSPELVRAVAYWHAKG